MLEYVDKCLSSARTPKLQLTAEQPLTGECWITPNNDIPCPRAKEKSQKGGGGVKSHLESNSMPARDPQRAQTKHCAHQDQMAP